MQESFGWPVFHSGMPRGGIAYVSNATYLFLVPAGVTKLYVEVGGGGAGGTGGGGAGQQARGIRGGPGGSGGLARDVIDVRPGSLWKAVVGNGGGGGAGGAGTGTVDPDPEGSGGSAGGISSFGTPNIVFLTGNGGSAHHVAGSGIGGAITPGGGSPGGGGGVGGTTPGSPGNNGSPGASGKDGFVILWW